ncbi:hypothetical protein J6TS2_48590 [Heyndrickxia sporothermodurans]|nr:hypothetical protein J6TS2_48590 [Heyndrickxia sporothermodurans]
MKLILLNDYKEMYKKGTRFFVISESEFIGVKEYVLQTENLTGKLILSEKEFIKNFRQI